MFDLNSSVFDANARNIPSSAKIVFVSDYFVEDYVGGAELTTQALIDTSPFEVYRLHSKDVTMANISQGMDKFWIFGNFSSINIQLIPTIVANLKYSILEYDYKYCKARSPERHQELFGQVCDCHNQMNGKIISAFFYGAMHLWWMSEKQKERYVTFFPFLLEKDNTVLSSVFDDKTLGYIKALREINSNKERKGWIVLGSNSWVKGAENAKKWCEDNQKDYEVIWNVSYDKVLEKLSLAEGFVYLPAGADTCPRMVIEAKLLGCELKLNEFVQNADEDWFATDDLQAIEEYLYTASKTFWSGIKAAMDYRPTISGYTTSYNSLEQGYPIENCINSMLQFCNEVCVVDGGSTDGTLEKLTQLSHLDNRIKIKSVPRDWNNKHFAVFDGAQKAEARKMCTSEYCWQMDSDEIVHELDIGKIIDLCRSMPKDVDIISLPVTEYWGGHEKVRIDIQPWKWRLSRNKPNITHGIPVDLRKYDDAGELYAAPGTDGCDMIDEQSGERLPHVTFYTQEIENVRLAALNGNAEAKNVYEQWFNTVIENLPGVFHYSWYDLERKIKLYKNYWTKHWNSLYGQSLEDTAENNMMFDVSWSNVTDDMIEDRAKLMKEKLGGWIWHRKWDGNVSTPHMNVRKNPPAAMNNH